MPKRLCRIAKAITLLTLAAASVKAGPVYSFTQIVVPGADQAYPTGINDAGQIVGNFFTPASYGRHGYIDTGGSFTQIDVPVANVTDTEITGINNAGTIVGIFDINDSCCLQPFLDTGGSFTRININGAIAEGINDAGKIVGEFSVPNDPILRHGFVATATGGSFTQIDMPGAAWTTLTGINNTGQIIGDGFGIGNFVYDGVNFTRIAVPGATATIVYGINDAGEIVGEFHTLNSLGLTDVHGFVFSDGSFTEVDVPGSVYTSISAINNAGQIVGLYETETGLYSFLGTPVPEPGTQTLLGIGMAVTGLIMMGRIKARYNLLSWDRACCVHNECANPTRS